MSGGDWMFQERIPLSRLFDFLWFEVDRPIVDLTGLQGFYDIDPRSPHGLVSGCPDSIDTNALFSSMKKVGVKGRSEKVIPQHPG
jgi:hypothetical protein